jgi:very-short-patch-repair endonuclease
MRDGESTEAREIWLREAARDQRRRATVTEQRLWEALRNRRLNGRRFRRQHPLGPYVVDFLCFEARLVVEVDGEIHKQQREYDTYRDEDLERQGYTVLRIPVDRVIHDLGGVLSEIERNSMAPPLPRAGEGVGG